MDIFVVIFSIIIWVAIILCGIWFIKSLICFISSIIDKKKKKDNQDISKDNEDKN